MKIELGADNNFVAFRLPKSEDYTLMVGQLNEDAIDYSVRSFLMASYDSSNPRLQIIPEEIFVNIPFSFSTTGTLNRSVVNKDNYINQANTCINSIRHGGADKVVLSRLIQYKHDTDDLATIFLQLSQQYPDSMVYLLHTQKTGTWMGAAPETLLAWNNDEAWTESLAGTSINHAEEWDEKNISEQEIVTDYIENLLSSYGIKYNKEMPKSVQKAHLTHRQTEIHFDTVKYMDHIVRQLHPTPAIHGSPRSNASELINRVETHDRLLYTGYIGSIDPYLGNHFFVNIRCMEMDKTHAYLYVGGGITRLSTSINEWKETEYKADVLRSVFNKLELQIK